MLTAQIVITILTVAAFGFSAAGVLRARSHARGSVGAHERDKTIRAQLTKRMEIAYDAATAEPDPARQQQMRTAALDRWHAEHREHGLVPRTRDNADVGTEELAEKMLRGTLESSSGWDIALIALGLLCGLAASLWGTWLT